jgi:soluble lytic murein transglycosylase-like protein
VPDLWIREVMRQESGGRASATSRVGAMGLMQVMPGTYRELAQRYNLGPDPYHPYDNLQAGAAYIREMYQLYGSPAFLAAYNAGPRRLEDYLWGNRGLPDETRNYVARVGPRIATTAPARRAPAGRSRKPPRRRPPPRQPRRWPALILLCGWTPSRMAAPIRLRSAGVPGLMLGERR